MRQTLWILGPAVWLLCGGTGLRAHAGDPLDEIDGTEQWDQGERAGNPRKLPPQTSRKELKRELNEWETIRQAWLTERQNYLKEQKLQKKAVRAGSDSAGSKKKPPAASQTGDLQVVPMVPPEAKGEVPAAAAKSQPSDNEIPPEHQGAVELPGAFKPADKPAPELKPETFNLATQPDRTPAKPRTMKPDNPEKEKTEPAVKKPPKQPADEPEEEP